MKRTRAGIYLLFLALLFGMGVIRIPQVNPVSGGALDPISTSGPVSENTELPALPQEKGLYYSSGAAVLETGKVGVFQGGKEVTLDSPEVVCSDSTLLRIDHGKVQEEYRFEKERVEQLFYLNEPVGKGALLVTTEIQTNLAGPVVEVRSGTAGWKDPRMAKGGLWFCDAKGEKQIAYYGAMAIDAAGRTIDIEPTYSSGQVFLEVPASYMARASYPLVVDPWIESASSATAGGVSTSGNTSGNPALCLDSSENPVIAWEENTGTATEIFVKRFSGTSWQTIFSSSTGADSTEPFLTSDSSGNLYLSWVEMSTGTEEIQTRKYGGSSWQDISFGASGMSSTSPSLACDSSGNLYAAWEENEGGGDTEVYLAKYDGSSWSGLGGSNTTGGVSQNLGLSQNPSLVVDPSGYPIVTWDDENETSSTTGPWNIYLRRFDGSSWLGIGGSNTGWGISNTATQSHQSNVAVDSSGLPVVTWIEATVAGPPAGSNQVYLRRYTGTQWEEINGSASGGGISNNTTNAGSPSVRINQMAQPVVSWADIAVSAGPEDIFLKFFHSDTNQWQEISLSASGGGVSNSAIDASKPDLALDSSGNPVLAWEDTGTGTKEVYLRKWYQNSPFDLKQMDPDGVSIRSVDALIGEQSVVLKGIPVSGISGLQVRLQVEVQSIKSSFTGVPTAESLLVNSGTDAVITMTGLSKGSKHWRARVVDSEGFSSQWVSFGGNADGDTDFAIMEYTKSSDGSCGLLGVEPLILFALLFFFRKRL